MSRIDIQEISFFKQQLKSSNEEMRAVLENIQLHTLAYAEDTSMSGQAVKASQVYFQATYTTITESLLEVLDVSEERLTKYLNDFSNQVDPSPSCRIDSDLLQMAADKVGQIKRKQEDLQRSLSSATVGLYEGKAQQLRMDLAEAVEQENILERYQEFEHGHNDFFQELCALMYKTRQALQHVLTNVTFNEQQGSYSFPVGYASAIADLQKELNEIRDIDAKKEKELEAYEIYAVVYTGENGKPEVMWILEQNGYAVRNYELTDYLKKTGQYLSKDRYQVLSLDDIEDKVLEGWKEGGYYLSGKKYSGVTGATLKASAYVQGGVEWVQESEFASAVLGLGLGTAAIRGSATYKKGSEANVTKPNVGVVQSRINLAENPTRFSPSRSAGMKHVRDRHFNPSKNAGQFTIPETELKNILQSKSVVSTPVSQIESGGFERIVDVGRNIGTVKPSLGGEPTTWIKIITDKAGNIITTYPIPKP